MEKGPELAESTGKPEKINLDDILKENGTASADGAAQDGSIEIVEEPSGAPPPEAGSSASEMEQLLADAMRERESAQDLYLRSRAELENFRKRVERDRGEEGRRACAAMLKEILPAIDNLDRALAQPAEAPGFREGVALVRRQLEDGLRRAGVEAIEALGEPFDPVYHEALAVERRAGLPPNTITEEICKGYLLGGRVLRPSQVKVTAAEEPAAGTGAEAHEGPETVGEKGESDGPDHRD